MTPGELGTYLHQRIPLTRALAVEVREAGPDRVVVDAPLEPNINHRDTVFGGSASAVAILAAWSVLYVRMRAEGLAGRIVIRANTMRYERPITARFSAAARAPDPAAWTRLTTALRRGRPARIHVTAELACNGERVGALDGEFVVQPPQEAATAG